jgi:hypothetical protein
MHVIYQVKWGPTHDWKTVDYTVYFRAIMLRHKDVEVRMIHVEPMYQ